MIRRLTARSLLALPLLLLAGLGTARATPPNLAVQPVSRMDTPWWRQRFADKQAEIAHGRFDLVWLGDSITQNWERTGPEPWRQFAPVWQH